MKRLFSFLLIAGISLGAHAQYKKFRAGLVMGPTFNVLKVQSKNIEKNGLGAGFTIGMTADFNLNPNIAVSTGIQFDLESFKMNYGSNTNSNLGDVFYVWNNSDISRYDSDANSFEDVGSDSSAFKLMSRKYKAKYVTIPLFLKFQTNMIGDFRYYGKFGLRTSFLAGVRMDDEGYMADLQNDGTIAVTSNSLVTNPDMKPLGFKKELSIVRTSIGIYAGSEWNFTGNTSLFAEFGFNYGLAPVLYAKSSTLANGVESDIQENVYSSFTQLDIGNNPQHYLELKIGLLF